MNTSPFRLFNKLVLLCVFFLAAFQIKAAEDEVWLLIDTKAKVLNVMQGSNIRAVYKNIAIGRNGADKNRVKGDNKTPLGIYRIGWVNNQSKFYKFYGVNYPSRIDARRALGQGLIDHSTFEDLVRADLFDQVPRQDTALGGQIGIHGLGTADPYIHKTMDWTRGCVAMTDEQIDSFGQMDKKRRCRRNSLIINLLLESLRNLLENDMLGLHRVMGESFYLK